MGNLDALTVGLPPAFGYAPLADSRSPTVDAHDSVKGPADPLVVPESLKKEIFGEIGKLQDALDALTQELKETPDSGLELDNLKVCQDKLTALKNASAGEPTFETLIGAVTAFDSLVEDIQENQHKFEPSRVLDILDKAAIWLGLALSVAACIAVLVAVAHGVIPPWTTTVGVAALLGGITGSMLAQAAAIERVSNHGEMKTWLESIENEIACANRRVKCAVIGTTTMAAIRKDLTQAADRTLDNLLAQPRPTDQQINATLESLYITPSSQCTLMRALADGRLSFRGDPVEGVGLVRAALEWEATKESQNEPEPLAQPWARLKRELVESSSRDTVPSWPPALPRGARFA
ncbi:hypothetical protein AB870_24400 (plasmid) [Pandoraea faecigallinarum]|uniref:Uncharacterized protein n=1 Tax=Pandoraea faecigallinarum TaxID=656179 RepID=A0A0H3X035_9BURK|nr:hypothetical protein [Pandoraea faecigallinarum]AKM33337.1 hypothetical protein AB870_24400 [Pandoraea faecigallinarum]